MIMRSDILYHTPQQNARVFMSFNSNIIVLFIDRPDNEAIEDSMNGWIDEKNFYNYQTNYCQKGQQCGHYTQVNKYLSYY